MVYVVQMVVKPVGQMSVYEVTMTVVIVSAGVEVGAGVTEGEPVMVVWVVPSPPLDCGTPVALALDVEPEPVTPVLVPTLPEELEEATSEEDFELELGNPLDSVVRVIGTRVVTGV